MLTLYPAAGSGVSLTSTYDSLLETGPALELELLCNPGQTSLELELLCNPGQTSLELELLCNPGQTSLELELLIGMGISVDQ